MKLPRVVAAAAAVCVLTSCAGGTPAPDPAPTPAPVPSAAPAPEAPAAPPGDDVAAVEAVFDQYNQALLGRDFAAACALSAPETIERLVTDVTQQLGQEVTGCEDAFTVIYSTPGAAEITDETVSTSEVRDVAVTGDTATITWTAQVRGQQPTVTSEMRRIDGQWRLVDTG